MFFSLLLPQVAPSCLHPTVQADQKMFASCSGHGSDVYISEANRSTDRHYIPEWITGEVGKNIQKRIWDDLLKRLESLGHSVDIGALEAK